jgi:NAD(P) transhydrogenase subunit alpha
MYSNNLFNLISEFWHKEDNIFQLDLEDEVQSGCIITHQGQVVNAMLKSVYEANNQTTSEKED